MRRRGEFSIRKRDGRLEWLRVTKLAHSIHRAFVACGEPDTWFALDVASAVLGGVRARRHRNGETGPCSAEELAESTIAVLVEAGYPEVSSCYAAHGSACRRRARLLASRGLGVDAESPAALPARASEPGGRGRSSNRPSHGPQAEQRLRQRGPSDS